MFSMLLCGGGALLLLLLVFMAGRFVGWHARGYYDEGMRAVREAAREAVLADVDTMIVEEMAARENAASMPPEAPASRFPKKAGQSGRKAAT